jgi:hypothetical protein
MNQFSDVISDDPKFISKVFTIGFSLPGSGTLKASLNYVLRSLKSKEKLSSKITKPNMWIEKSVVSFKFFIVGILTRMQSVFS